MMTAGHGDESHHLLDMNTMASLAAGLSVDFPDFRQVPAASDAHHMPHGSRPETLDTPMGGLHVPAGLAGSEAALQPQQHQKLSYISADSIPGQVSNGTIVDTIDAQIQFLQDQKLQHQQRHVAAQHAATFFANQHHRIVPPTPQSLELQPSAGPFFTTQAIEGGQQQHMDYRYRRMSDQEVRDTPDVLGPRELLTAPTRCPSRLWCHPLSHRSKNGFPWMSSMRFRVPISVP